MGRKREVSLHSQSQQNAYQDTDLYLTLGRGGEEQLGYVSEGGEKKIELSPGIGRKYGGKGMNEQGRQLREGVKSQRKGNGWEVTVRTSALGG